MAAENSNKYRDVLITAKRARQLQGGATAAVSSKSMKVCRVAQEEMAAGKLDANTVGYRVADDSTASAKSADLGADMGLD